MMVCLVIPSSLELRTHVDDFSKVHGKVTTKQIYDTMSVDFVPQGWESGKGGTIGSCTYPMFGQKGILEIDPEFWNRASDSEKWGLMWHELGHCVCSLGHPIDREELDKPYEEGWFIRFLHRLGIKTANRDPRKDLYLIDGCPKTLMHPYLPSSYCLTAHKARYQQDIVKRCERPFGLYNIFKKEE